MDQLSKFDVLKRYFTVPPLTISEIKALSIEERTELATLAAKELGVELKPVDAK